MTEATAGSATSSTQGDDLRVPFWIVLAGVGAGAFWMLVGVLVGSRLARRPSPGRRAERRRR